MSSEKESVEVSAKTVEEAIERGLKELGRTRDQVEVEVLYAGRSGVLGIGAEDARVRLVARPASHIVEAQDAPREKEEEMPAAPAPLATEAEPVSSQVAELAIDILQGLLDRMQVRAVVKASPGDDLAEEGEEPALVLDITGDDLGVLIGRRGETLRALQYMTRLMLSRKLGRWEPVIVDVESYRVRRRRSLRQLAVRMAERVAFSKQRVVLEAMPANERRIIHIALRDHPQVTTRSIGEGDHRKVTIIPK
ncbi:MAG: KH domain-containing protein [Anaerolineae bacterium]